MPQSLSQGNHHPHLLQTDSYSFAEIKAYQQEANWDQLKNWSLAQALEFWLKSLKPLTQKNYATSFKVLSRQGLVDLNASLQAFALINHEQIIDEIKLQNQWQEATKQARAAAYISFTAFLQRRTQGIIQKALANREGANPTFFKVRDKVKTNPLSKAQTQAFLRELGKLNHRDLLIAKLILHGGKRKGEVLALKIEEIDFFNSQIRFTQSKTKGVIKETLITYPPSVMDELESYCQGRTGLCFVTRNGQGIAPYQLNRTFIKAGQRAKIPFPVTPHMLRVTLVTRLKELKIQDSEIMKITGHASPAQLLAYDRSDLADNPTAKYNFLEA